MFRIENNEQRRGKPHIRQHRNVEKAGEERDAAVPRGLSHAEIVRVPIGLLRDADSPRSAGVDPDHVRDLAETDALLPPLLVHRETMRVVDGVHRLAAARRNGQPDIEVRLFSGTPEDAFLQGVRANATHGMPLKSADRRAAAVRIIGTHPRLSDRAVARVTGLAARTVAALRAETAVAGDDRTRVGADGRTRPLSSAEGRITASLVLRRSPDATLREIAREAGISVGTARDVKNRVLAGLDPVPARHREPRVEPPAERFDLTSALEELRRDPSLRYSESGRAMLRWLGSRIVTFDQWERITDAVAPHCRATLADIALECARTWADLADQIGNGAD